MRDYRPSSYKGASLPSSAIDFLIELTKDFMGDSKAKLNEYTALLREYQEDLAELNPQEDQYMRDLRESLHQAEQLVYEVEQLRKEVSDL
jgi:hypothetical protein